MTTAPEAAVGEKRPREDESSDQPPATRQTPANNVPTPQNAAMNQMNGNFNMPIGMAGMAGQMGMDMAGNGMPGFQDALYIGDLQWVRVFCRLVYCIFTEDIDIHPFNLVVNHSGLQMRIYAKLRTSWGSTSTTRISHFPSTR